MLVFTPRALMRSNFKMQYQLFTVTLICWLQDLTAGLLARDFTAHESLKKQSNRYWNVSTSYSY